MVGEKRLMSEGFYLSLERLELGDFGRYDYEFVFI